jgi:nicotinamide mononucleotide transporter
MEIFNINFILFTLAGYPVSAVELIGTISGLLCVVYCAKGAVAGWPLGIVNAVFFFILFYQVRLYPDMFLQVYFLLTSLYGWWRWKNPKTVSETDSRSELKISAMSSRAFLLLGTAALTATAAAGYFISGIHNLLPSIFPEPSSFPYADSFVAVMSVTAQILLSLKKRETWILWIITDAAAASIYFMKGIYLVGIEYVIFGLIASAGLWNWTRIFSNYEMEEAI